MAEGNTPTGNPGAGTVETTSAPTTSPAPTAGTSGIPTAAGGPSGRAVGGAPQVDAPLTEADFRKDGNIRADAARRIEENVSPRGAERSYNEVTGETTVTTTVGGQTVSFVETGDTRSKGRPQETAMDSLARASEDAEESK